MKPVTSWYYHPSSNDKADCGFVGINNLGATCYMNALLQQLYHIPTFSQGILAAEPLERGYMDRRDFTNEQSLLSELQRLFTFLQESELKSYDPMSFCKAYKVGGRPVIVNVQQDVDEFMNGLCSDIENQLRGTCHSQLFQKNFGVVLANEIRSVEKDYPYYSDTPEAFFRIPLEVKNLGSLDKALDLLVASDKLDGDNAYVCEKYGRKLKATKRYCIKSLSNTLIFNLKRFEYEYSTECKVKLNDFFHFPLSLNMKSWTQEFLNNDSVSESGEPIHPDWYYIYELVGVLVHSGSAESGHYYSYIRNKTDDGQVEWFEYNDARVSPFNINDLQRECYGGKQEVDVWENTMGMYSKKWKDIEKSAYMLFYQRVTPVQIKYWGDDDFGNLSQSNDEIAKHEFAVERARQLAEQKERENSKRLIHGLPRKYYHIVCQENNDFLRDRQFFDSSYFDFMLQLANSLTVSPIDKKDDTITLEHVKLVCRFFIDILVHAADKSTLSRWVPVLRRYFRHNPNAARYFLVLTLVPTEDKVHPYWDHDPNILKRLFLDCPHETTRVFFSDLVTAAFVVLSPIEYEMNLWGRTRPNLYNLVLGSTAVNYYKEDFENISVCCQVMQSLWTMIDVSRTVWQQFKQYFEIIRNFALAGYHNRDFLRSLNVVKEFREYYVNSSTRTERNRPTIMDPEHFPDLREFYEVLEVVIRGARTERKPEDGQEVDESFYRTPFSTPGMLNVALTPQELKLFYDHTFFPAIIEMDYNCISLTRIFRHVSWECHQRSQDIVVHILEQFRGISKVPIHARIMDPLLSLNDSLKMKRVIWSVSPYKVNSGRPTSGLLGLMRNDDKHTQFLVHFLVYLAMRTRDESSFSVYFYLLQRKSELYWMKDFLITKLDSTNEPVPKSITQEEANAAEELLRTNPPGNQNSNVDAKNLYIVVCKLIEYSSALVEHPHWSMEEEFFRSTIETLQKNIKLANEEQENLNNRMQNIHNYYRSKCPEIQPPPEMAEDVHGNPSWKVAKTESERSVAAQQGMGLGAQRNSSNSRAIVPYVNSEPDFPGPQRPSQPAPNLRVVKPSLPMRHGPTIALPGNLPTMNTQATGDMSSSEFNHYSQSLESPTSPSDIPSLEPAPVQGPSHPEYGGPMHPGSTTVITVPPMGEPDDADSLVASLKEMMGDHLSTEVVKLALINSNWNPDRAAENLFDDNKVKMYTREAEEKRTMEKNVNSEKGDGKRGSVI